MSTTSESRKCESTSHGFRWKCTVSAPSGACSERPEEDDEREQAEATARGEPGDERDEDRQEREHAVPELDVGVVALRLEVVRRAAGPVLAPEARAGEPHGRAGGDDQDEHHRVRDREPAERLGGEREAAQTSERLRADVHLRNCSPRSVGALVC